MTRLLILGIALLAVMAGKQPAHANSPILRAVWLVTFYNEPLRQAGQTQCIKFAKTNNIVGVTHFSGTWTAPTFSGWGGEWIQFGDNIRFWGVTGGGLSTYASGMLQTDKLIGGEFFVHFLSANGKAGSAGNWSAKNAAGCPKPSLHRTIGDPAGER
jgi:hypothetical protein